jgi:type IV pilus assembly protein PilQ
MWWRTEKQSNQDHILRESTTMLMQGWVYKKDLLFLVLCLAAASWLFIGCATGITTEQPSEVQKPAKIQAIMTSLSGEEMTVVRIVNSASAHYSTFKLVDPPRLVLDIRGVPGSDLPPITQVNDGNVADIRVEKGKFQAITTRVVVGLSRVVDYKVTEADNIITLTLLPRKMAAEMAQEQAGTISVKPQEAEEAEGPDRVPSEPRIFFQPRPISLNQVLGVDFTMLERGKSRLTVTTDKKSRYSLARKGKKTLVLILEETTIPPLLLRRLDSTHFEGAVDRVKSTFSSADNRLALAISLREMVPFHVDQTESEIRIDFGPTSIKPPEKKIVPVKVVEAKKIPPKVAAVRQKDITKEDSKKKSAGIPGLRRAKYTGTPMTMDFVNAEVTNILRLIGEVSSLNIIWGPDVKGTVSMRLKNVPWDQALDLVLANNDLAMRRQGNVIWVATRAHLAEIDAEEKRKRDEAEAEITKRLEERKKAKELGPLITEYFPLDFASAAELKEHIVSIKSDEGDVSVDVRTNTIIFKDIAENIEEVRKIVRRFDAPVKQIMIEARIVDASTKFSRELGVRWNSLKGLEQKRTSVSWGTDPTQYTTGGDRIVGGTFSSNAPDDWSGNIGIAFARVTDGGTGLVDLDATLALAETEGKVKIMSAPRVITSNGVEATISRGDIIYKEVATADQISIEELPATLSLTVKPTVSFNDYVTMEVKVTDDKVFSDLSGKTEKGIQTKLMVRSGETVVIGGIYKEDKSESEEGIPWLRNIPYLGWLFKARTKTTERTELLIFLTPTVLPTDRKKV